MVDSITTEVIRHSMLSAAQEMARNFDQLLERVMRAARIGEFANDPV